MHSTAMIFLVCDVFHSKRFFLLVSFKFNNLVGLFAEASLKFGVK